MSDENPSLALDPWDEPCAGAPAGQPVNADAVRVGRPVEFLLIAADGGESARRGRVWADAPALGGMRAWWVVPDEPLSDPLSAARGGALLVVRASRRHQVGRRASNGRWDARGGRYVDVGTLYLALDRASPQQAVHHRTHLDPGPPRAIKVTPLALVDLRGLSGWYQNRPLGVIHGGTDY